MAEQRIEKGQLQKFLFKIVIAMRPHLIIIQKAYITSVKPLEKGMASHSVNKHETVSW